MVEEINVVAGFLVFNSEITGFFTRYGFRVKFRILSLNVTCVQSNLYSIKEKFEFHLELERERLFFSLRNGSFSSSLGL